MVAATQLPPCVPSSSLSTRQTRRLEPLGKRREDLRHLGNAERDLSRPDGTKAGRPSEWARASQFGGVKGRMTTERAGASAARRCLKTTPNKAIQTKTNPNKHFAPPRGGRGCQ